VTSGFIVVSAAFWSLRTRCGLAAVGVSGRLRTAVAVQIVKKVDGKFVDIERIHLVHNGADLGLLLSSALEHPAPAHEASDLCLFPMIAVRLGRPKVTNQVARVRSEHMSRQGRELMTGW